MTKPVRRAILVLGFFAVFSAGAASAESLYFSLDAEEYAAGDPVGIRFTAPMTSPEGNQSWITIVPPEADEAEYADYIYVDDKATTAEIAAPKKAGAYEVRLHSGYPKKEYNLIQRLPITVISVIEIGGDIEFKGISSLYSNSATNWRLDFGDGEGSLRTKYSNAITSWEVELPSGSASIQSRYSNSLANWVYSGTSGEIGIKGLYSNSIAPWKVSSANESLTVATVYSNSLAKWSISGIGDGMSVYTMYSNSFLKWVIEDRIPDADPDLKMAAVFACIISTMIK